MSRERCRFDPLAEEYPYETQFERGVYRRSEAGGIVLVQQPYTLSPAAVARVPMMFYAQPDGTVAIHVCASLYAVRTPYLYHPYDNGSPFLTGLLVIRGVDTRPIQITDSTDRVLANVYPHRYRPTPPAPWPYAPLRLEQYSLPVGGARVARPLLKLQ